MKRFVILPFIFVAACSSPEQPQGSATPAPAAGPVQVLESGGAPLTSGWEITEGIATPESVYFDEQSGLIFSSQISGQPTDRDGNGRIAKISADGKMIAADWVTGLNAPKGLRSHDGTLWTADLDEIIGIDIASGKVTTRLKVPNAQFLNDVATGTDGTVYVSDMMANRIHTVKNGELRTFAQGEMLEWPNGLLVDGGRLIVGSWGRPEADFTTKVPGRLFALDLTSKQKTLITPKPFANIDGLESDGRGGYIISDYLAGKIYRVSATGETQELRSFMPGAADIGFAAATNILLVPHMNENKVAAYDLSEALR